MGIKHENNGKCAKCLSIIGKYPGFYEPLLNWFLLFQSNHPEGHISEAGRGAELQEVLFLRKASRAHYGQSAHNYNCALDIFENTGKKDDIYEHEWFIDVLKPNLPSWIDWYGRPDASFRELPHIEVRNWKQLRDIGLVRLVEPRDKDKA